MAAPGGAGFHPSTLLVALLGPVVETAERPEGANGNAASPMVTPVSLSPPVDNLGEKTGYSVCVDWPGATLHRLWRDLPPWRGCDDAKVLQGRVLEITPEGGADLAGVAAASVDTVASVFALCRVGDLDTTLAQVHRALAPGGVLLFLEHAAAPGWRQRLQRAVTPLWQRMVPGCHLDRDIPAAIRAAGMAITDIDRFPLPWARPLMVKGVQGAARVRVGAVGP